MTRASKRPSPSHKGPDAPAHHYGARVASAHVRHGWTAAVALALLAAGCTPPDAVDAARDAVETERPGSQEALAACRQLRAFEDVGDKTPADMQERIAQGAVDAREAGQRDDRYRALAAAYSEWINAVRLGQAEQVGTAAKPVFDECNRLFAKKDTP